MDAVGLQQAAVADADFLGNVAIPPVGGESVAAVVFLVGFDRDVIRPFELNDVWREPSHAGITSALCIGGETEIEFRAGVAQSIDIADLSLDGSEVRHVGLVIGSIDFVRCWLEISAGFVSVGFERDG